MRHDRTIALIGEEQFDVIRSLHIMILGLGGVGGHAAEALARFGIGHLSLVDDDLIHETNINRQIIALTSTIGRSKTKVMSERIHDIDPQIEVTCYETRITAANATSFLDLHPDLVIDCIDDVQAKTAMIIACEKANIKIISAMGFANKLHPEAIRIDTLDKTSVCPLARAVRANLRSSGNDLKIPVVYSLESPIISKSDNDRLGSVSFVPAVAGMMLAGMAADIIMDKEKNT